MGVDWADGDYGRMAAALEPAAAALVAYARVRADDRVIDVGTGTGNAAAAAAQLGARVIGVDPAEGLLEVARDRIAMIDADVVLSHGSAEALPVGDDAADVTLSAFAVIFSEDPEAAIAEMARATRPGGTIALTTWRAAGPLCSIGETLRRRLPVEDDPDHRRWGDDDWLRALLDGAGLVDIEIAEKTVEFDAPSPEGFLQELEEHHPGWRAALRQLAESDRAAAHADSLEILRAGNESPDAFLITSTYALVRADVPATG